MTRMKYVQRRANRFEFRYQLPDDLAGHLYPTPWPDSLKWCINPRTGRFKTELVRSLKSNDGRTAERAALPLIEQAHRLVDLARRRQANQNCTVKGWRHSSGVWNPFLRLQRSRPRLEPEEPLIRTIGANPPGIHRDWLSRLRQPTVPKQRFLRAALGGIRAADRTKSKALVKRVRPIPWRTRGRSSLEAIPFVSSHIQACMSGGRDQRRNPSCLHGASGYRQEAGRPSRRRLSSPS